MKFLVRLAAKNLWRYGRRTLITAAAIALGLATYVLLDSMLVGADEESVRNLIWYETGSARIMHPDYWDERDRAPLRHVIEDPQSVLDAVRSRDVAATPRTTFSGELIVWRDPFPEDGSLLVHVTAIDPETDGRVYRFDQWISDGRPLQEGEPGVILGSWLAEDLGAEVGYPLIISARSRYGARVTIDAEVVGILNSPNPVINRGGIFLPLDIADLYLDMEGAVTQIDLRFADYARVEAPIAELEELPALRDLSIADWRLLGADYIAMMEADSVGSGIILFLVFIIAAVGVSNTMLMTIFERTREIGMMRALGMDDRAIRNLFLIEASGIGLIGAAAGVALGALGNIPMVRVGIDYSAMFRTMDAGYRSTGVLYGAWVPSTFVIAALMGIVLAVIVALVPTRRALRMNIPRALRQQ